MDFPIFHQVKNHAVAIISLIIAIIALFYSTWRNEITESNRNTRMAAFEVLKNLGELQILVNYRYYQPQQAAMGNPIVGWGYIALISDLSKLLPKPVPETVERLIASWNENWKKIDSDQQSTDQVSEEIDDSRQAVLKVLMNLK